MRHLCLLVLMGLLTFSAAVAQEEVDLTSNLEASINPETVQPLAQFGWGHPRDLAWMPDGKSFAVATAAGVYFYDAGDILAAPRFFETGAQALDAIAISPDGKYLATGGDDVYLWDISTGIVVDEMRAGVGVSDVAFSPDGSLLAATTMTPADYADCGLYVFDVASGRLRFTHLEPYNWFFEIEFFPDSQRVLVAASNDSSGPVTIIDLQTGAVSTLSMFGDDNFHRLLPDSNSVLVYEGYSFYRFNLPEQYDPALTSEYKRGYLTEIGLLPGAKQFFSLTQEGELAWWDSETLEQL
ncbi:MAG TPA: WD40 repeat domain-containing protein, partial [Phototrophicaceae bacterium]|nr:WD40 repeat domain-containing protein [Phototrophicaceae bacterium]